MSLEGDLCFSQMDLNEMAKRLIPWVGNDGGSILSRSGFNSKFG